MTNKTEHLSCVCYSLCLLALWIPAFYFANEWGQEAIDKQLYSFAVLN